MYIKEMIERFAREEDGIALTEYLILLGLLVGGVIAAVTTAGGNLSTVWTGWGTWWTTAVDAPAAS
jgi:pilus assembly protein Flp/PilA